MNRDEIKERVCKVVAQVLKVQPEGIQENHRFAADLGAESVQSIELVAGFEEEFGVEMDEDEAFQVQSVGGAVDFIARYVN